MFFFGGFAWQFPVFFFFLRVFFFFFALLKGTRPGDNILFDDFCPRLGGKSKVLGPGGFVHLR